MAKAKINPKLNKLMRETVVVRAVDDGEGVALYAPVDDTKGPYETDIPFEHWAVGKASARQEFAAFKTQVKERFSSASDEFNVQKENLKDEFKKGAQKADAQIKANPYLFVLGAIGAGFVLGRMFMGRSKKSLLNDVSNFPDSPKEHTGVHIRSQSRFA